MRFVFPTAVVPGDLIAVVAPSSSFPRDSFWAGLAWLRARYRVQMRSDILSLDAYLAGDDARRGEELARAMRDPEVRAIVAARGGYGAMRLLDALPWDAFVASPKWLVGFSDITALHVELWKRGVASIHGPHVNGLGKPRPRTRASWLAALERPSATRKWSGLRVLRGGEASGVLVGGNLAMLEAMAAGRGLAVPEGAVVVLEDVGERPYRVDRMLTALRLGGHFSRVSAIVLGEFTDCDPGADGRRVEEVLEERTRSLGVPVYAGAPFGHGDVNDAFVLGARGTVEAGTLTMHPYLPEG